jgi:hypothetical protein
MKVSGPATLHNLRFDTDESAAFSSSQTSSNTIQRSISLSDLEKTSLPPRPNMPPAQPRSYAGITTRSAETASGAPPGAVTMTAPPHVTIEIAEEVSEFGSQNGSTDCESVAPLERDPSESSPTTAMRMKQKAKTFAITCGKVYVSFLAISSGIKLLSNPSDIINNPGGFFGSLPLGTARADGLQVQESRNAVLKTYGKYINPRIRCVNPRIRFVHNLSYDGQKDAGLYDRLNLDSTKANADRISFNTYNFYLSRVAAHEVLHCYTHQNFNDAVYAENSGLTPTLQKTLIEGTTEYFTRKTPVSNRGDRLHVLDKYNKFVKLIGKVVTDVGEETLKKAYFSGDRKSIEQVLKAGQSYE